MTDSFIVFGFDDPLPEPPGRQPSFILRVELVPATSWGANLRSALPRSDWDRLRKKAYRLAGYKCEICGGKGPKHPVECHEVWEYDDERHVQRLERLIALCPACHEVKHFGRAETMGQSERAFVHLMRVNGWTNGTAQGHLYQAFDKWRSRSFHQWKLDLSWLGGQGIEVPEMGESPDGEPMSLAQIELTEAPLSERCPECDGPLYPASPTEVCCGTRGCPRKDSPVPKRVQ